MKTKIKWGIGVLVLAVVIGFWAYQRRETKPISEPPMAGDTRAIKWQEDLLLEINALREVNGVPALILSERLNRSAQVKADLLMTRNEWTHYRPTDIRDLVNSIPGKVYYGYGENLAIRYKTAKEAVTAWEKSPTHKKNLLNDYFTDMGIGIADHPQGLLVVLHLGAGEL